MAIPLLVICSLPLATSVLGGSVSGFGWNGPLFPLINNLILIYDNNITTKININKVWQVECVRPELLV